MKTIQLFILIILFSACSKKTDLDNIVDSDMKATLRDYINSPNEFPVYFYAVDYSLRYPENKVLLDSTTNKQMSFDIPYLVANNKRYDIRKIWGMREAQKEIKPTKLITTELKIEFTK
ncbi:MAG: hypothetical protein RLZZ306_1039 [Bacteroidota bacterium]|jgi:hypothetical protein